MIEENFAEQLASKQGQVELAREITDEVNAQLPQEKLRLRRELDRTAEEIKGLTSNYADGRGQAIASIPPLAYMRWNLQYPGIWKQKDFVDEFLYDNRECLLPGYKPKPKTVYFDMGGKPTLTVGASLYWQNKERINALG